LKSGREGAHMPRDLMNASSRVRGLVYFRKGKVRVS